MTSPTPRDIGTKIYAPPSGGGGGGGGGGGFSLDYHNDPILARVKALSQEAIRQAEAYSTASNTQSLIQYGDPELAQTLGFGQDVQRQAGRNPSGTAQTLRKGYSRRNTFDITRPLSDKANLYYSTERGRQLALSGEQYLHDRATAQAAVQKSINDANQQLLQTKLDWQMKVIDAEQAAYERALQMSLYSAGVG